LRGFACAIAVFSILGGLVVSVMSDAVLQMYLIALNKAKSSTEVQTTLFAQGFMMIFVPLQYWLAHQRRVSTETALMFLVFRLLLTCSLGQTPCDAMYFFTRIGQLEPKEVSKQELGKMIALARSKGKKKPQMQTPQSVVSPTSEVQFKPIEAARFEIGDDEVEFKGEKSQEMTKIPPKKKAKKKNGPEFAEEAEFGDFQSNQPDIESSAF
jgi:hypothetical protein